MLPLYFQVFIKRIIYQMIYAVTAVLLVVVVFASFITTPGINGFSQAMFGDMIYGKANQPYVSRVLLPYIVRLIVNIIPVHVRGFITQSNLHILNWEPGLLPEYIIVSVLTCFSLVGFLFAMQYLFKGLFQTPKVFADITSLAALAGVPSLFIYYSYIYDLPTLFLFTLGLGLMLNRKWAGFLLIFLLACLNKETSVLLLLAFAIYFYRRWELITPERFFRLLSLQTIIFVLIRLGIAWNFRNNPGRPVYFHLFSHNLNLLRSIYTLPNLLIALGFMMLVFYRWAEKPVFLKNSIFVLIPLLGSALLFGYIEELRDYYEVYPILFLLISHTVANIVGINFVSLPTPDRIASS